MTSPNEETRYKIILQDDTIRKIDENRGILTRIEFIDLCIRSFLGNEERSYIIPSRHTVLAKSSIKPRKVVVKDELKSPLEVSSIQFLNVYLIFWWVLAIITYGIIDLITSYWAFQAGLPYTNPIMALLGNITALFFFKVSTTIGLFLLSYALANNVILSHSIPILTMTTGLFLTINNVLMLNWKIGLLDLLRQLLT